MNAVSPGHGVVTFDDAGFEAACAALMRLVAAEGAPDLLIGVRTGGYHVAEAMVRATGAAVPILPITCRRPTTRYKALTAPGRRLIASLPRWILDKLRVIEHRLLTRKPRKTSAREIDAAELTAFENWVANAGVAPVVVVVDDSVDTGVTLACVVDALRARMPRDGALRLAAITVTTENPIIRPDHVLLQRRLCRFPWSLDARMSQAC